MRAELRGLATTGPGPDPEDVLVAAELFLQGRLQDGLGQRLQQPTRAGQCQPRFLGLTDQARHHGDLVQTQPGLQQRLEKKDRSNARQTLEDLERDGNDEGVVEEAEDAVNQTVHRIRPVLTVVSDVAKDVPIVNEK